jgi:hypothetical protein
VARRWWGRPSPFVVCLPSAGRASTPVPAAKSGRSHPMERIPNRAWTPRTALSAPRAGSPVRTLLSTAVVPEPPKRIALARANVPSPSSLGNGDDRNSLCWRRMRKRDGALRQVGYFRRAQRDSLME